MFRKSSTHGNYHYFLWWWLFLWLSLNETVEETQSYLCNDRAKTWFRKTWRKSTGNCRRTWRATWKRKGKQGSRSCPVLGQNVLFVFFVLCLFLGLAFMFSLWIISNMRKNRGNTLINHPYTHPLASMIICQPRETCFWYLNFFHI